mgnify:CR=1 FL=1
MAELSDADKRGILGADYKAPEVTEDSLAADAAARILTHVREGSLSNILVACPVCGQTELRSEWGGEYDGNIGAISEFMTAQLGEEGFGRMMGMRLMDGSRLQDDPAFVKMMAQVATDYYGSNAIYNGDSAEVTTALRLVGFPLVILHLSLTTTV